MSSAMYPYVCRFGSSDRLSSLPVELINQILSYVPMRDVVRTSLLSRFWRFKWMSVSHLVFDARSLPPRRTKPEEFVNHVLLLHNAEISRFEIRDYLNSYCLDVDQWLLLLPRKLVKQLILRFPLDINRFKLSSSIFSCQTLTLLELSNCSLNFPFHAKGFPNLAYLVLRNVTLSDETIGSLISNSPLLHTLFLYHCDGFTRLSIYAPNLLKVYFYGSFDSINFGNTPLLRGACMELQNFTDKRKCRLEDDFGCLVNVKKLRASELFLEMLAVLVQERQHITFPCLTHVAFEMNFRGSNEISTSLRLFRGAPYLLSMNVMNCSNGPAIHAAESWKVQLDEEEVIFPRLETVVLSKFKGTETEMRFVEFILLNAGVLQTIKVEWHIWCILNHQLKANLLEKMIRFKRTSPKAQIIFK